MSRLSSPVTPVTPARMAGVTVTPPEKWLPSAIFLSGNTGNTGNPEKTIGELEKQRARRSASMVSMALKDLSDWFDAQESPGKQAEPPGPDYADALLRELDWCGCRVVLVDGRPSLRGNVQAVEPDTLALLKEHRAEIIARLEEQAGGGEMPARAEPSGIRRHPETGKLHAFGNPSPAWLRGQGWTWCDQRRRHMAPYPHDRDDPPPHLTIDGGHPRPPVFPDVIHEPSDNGDA